MANPSPSSSLPDNEKGSYRSITGAGRQLLRNAHTECKQPKSFWSVLAKKAKHVLLDDDSSTHLQSDGGQNNNLQSQCIQARPPAESKQQQGETPLLQRRLVALTSSLSSLGGSIGNAIEESLNKMEAKASDLMSSKKGTDSAKATDLQDANYISRSFVHKEPFSKPLPQGEPFVKPTEFHDSGEMLQTGSLQQVNSAVKPSQHHHPNTKPLSREDSFLRPLQQQHSGHSAADKETQLKASRDVAMAMAAKAKLLLRELKEAKADLAAARDRCVQLEEENRIIRASINNGLKPDEEDLVRIQLETLLAEKARLAQENAYFSRENQFLREMIEYHRLTMHNGGTVLEESMLEVTEKPLDHNFDEADELPPETIISTVN
ncbi:hypothetical protein GOP47_0001017 [Adiantum capillus-veneris]|uniref:Uncharacterized protein n=1 Tax=Adiantum capillus-veneris TaxID=13818 RepID=A0A9D4ZTF2_ADICA|nr:hypothetical protein GOP47_0000824 [Adiantum capillus-veneris]KAI5084848.1 hypothetical protein GOP47_0001017 [Adiantum capillus-veneris]